MTYSIPGNRYQQMCSSKRRARKRAPPRRSSGLSSLTSQLSSHTITCTCACAFPIRLSAPARRGEVQLCFRGFRQLYVYPPILTSRLHSFPSGHGQAVLCQAYVPQTLQRKRHHHCRCRFFVGSSRRPATCLPVCCFRLPRPPPPIAKSKSSKLSPWFSW